MPKRLKYSATYKRLVIKFAEASNNCAAARKYNVNEKLVRDWRKNADKIEEMPHTKCANRGKTCQWPNLEKELIEWIQETRKRGYIVTRNMARLQALALAKKMEIPDFKGTSNWCLRFMKRHNLVLHQKTRMSQKLPSDLEDNVN